MKSTLSQLLALRRRREQSAARLLFAARQAEAQTAATLHSSRETEQRIHAARDENRRLAHEEMCRSAQASQSIQQLTFNFTTFDALAGTFTQSRRVAEIQLQKASARAGEAANSWRTRQGAVDVLETLDAEQAAKAVERAEAQSSDDMDEIASFLWTKKHDLVRAR